MARKVLLASTELPAKMESRVPVARMASRVHPEPLVSPDPQALAVFAVNAVRLARRALPVNPAMRVRWVCQVLMGLLDHLV